MYWVYILTNKNHTTLYTGVTNNIYRPLEEHRKGAGSSFTAKYNLKKRVYAESTNNPTIAIAWEKRIKGWKRDRKIGMINALNPEWKDLSKV